MMENRGTQYFPSKPQIFNSFFSLLHRQDQSQGKEILNKEAHGLMGNAEQGGREWACWIVARLVFLPKKKKNKKNTWTLEQISDPSATTGADLTRYFCFSIYIIFFQAPCNNYGSVFGLVFMFSLLLSLGKWYAFLERWWSNENFLCYSFPIAHVQLK